MRTTTRAAGFAMFAITATAVTCGTADAQPATTLHAPISVTGTDHGVRYSMRRSGNDISVDILGANLRKSDDTVQVTAADGTSIAALPLDIAGTPLTATITGTHLTATASAQDIGHWELTSPRQRSIGAGIAIGAAIGVFSGLFVGLALGILTSGLLIPIALPIGLIGGILTGAVLGGIAGGSIPNSDVPDQWQYQQECHYYGNDQICW